MKRITRKLAYLLFTVIYLVTVSGASAAFAAEDTMSVTLRIEGVEKNLFYDTVEVPYTDTLTLQQALTYIDTQEDSITITGIDTDYITDINGETAGSFGGWDGWLYKVNGQDAVVGISGQELADGDSVLLYYGDPFGVGMQFPAADTSDLANGVITFTSTDTTYDASYNPIVTVNPVKGATVTWSNGDTVTDYVTDENGAITIDADQLTEGSHAVQIAKTGDTNLPLVLRFAPDYTITVEEIADSTATDTSATDSSETDNTAVDNAVSDTTVSDTATQAPETGEQIAKTVIFLVLAVGALSGVIFLRRKDKNVKEK